MLEFVYYILLIVAIAVFLIGLKRNIDFVRSGHKSSEPRLENLGERIKVMVKDSLAFLRLYRRGKMISIAHLFVLWGFLVLIFDIILITICYVFPDLFRNLYLLFKFSMTAGGLLFTFGLVSMAINRYIVKPSRFEKKFDAKDDNLALLILLFAAIFGFILKEFFRFSPDFANSSLVQTFWFIHAVMILAFVALIPYSKLMHIFAAPISVLTKTNRHPGIVRPPQQREDYIGLVTRKDLTRRDLLSSLACMRCGRCQDACPAFNSHTSLSPMFLIQNLRNIEKIASGKMEMLKPYEVKFGTESDGGEAEKVEKKEEVDTEVRLVDTILDMDATWACTTCRACMEMCPVYIEQMEIIQEIRRGIIESGEAPPDIRDLLTNIQKQKNPWGEAKFKRDQWTKKSEIPVKLAKDGEFEWLWFVGCANSFDNRNIPITAKIAKLMNDIGVNYAVIGRDEGCCGNEVRRVGEEGLFQLLKEENVRQFEKFGVKKIITISPHCYNTLKNEYDGYEVKFVLETIYEAIKNGKIKLKKEIKKKITFHDPCYLGRYNGMYELPREILKAIPGIELVEMPRNRNKSFCCGAGGGNLVREYPGEFRPNNLRAREAAETGAEILAVACPFCMIMLEDGVKTEKLDNKIKVLDVIELVYESAYE
ncbi:MAG: heterodisulfide reductase-related iron-sulfur binding cluster [Archaeoglobaceae archaeon]|nr:heterodisulfide reductase-related iron-sulfur binding cluster [Archaeoglobaceae archaeon]MDW7989772.1 heterodisulfide reductase-related iron-sulfur binding cluster [Archaeoglobaceae archaeon]